MFLEGISLIHIGKLFQRIVPVYLADLIPGVPKKVQKFEIKNLCSDSRSISKIDVIY